MFVGSKRTPVYPDGYCIISSKGARTYNFVESDGGTEGLQQVARQIRTYLEYVESGLYEQRFGTAYWRVIFVTQSKKRLDRVRKRVAELGGGGNFWFTTFADISPATILTEPIWYKVRGEEQFVFL